MGVRRHRRGTPGRESGNLIYGFTFLSKKSLDKDIYNVYTLGMNTAVIITKTEPKIKAKARRVAKELGLSLSALINAWLRQLIKTKTVIFSAADEEPTQYLLDALKESREDIKAGRVISFNTNVGKA